MQVFGMPIQFASVAQIATRRPRKDSSSSQPTEGTRLSGRMPHGETGAINAVGVPSSTQLRFRPKNLPTHAQQRA